MREERAVAGEDVRLGGGGRGGGGGVGPGAGVLDCVGGGEGEGTECDADVEIGEDELDAGGVGQDGAGSQFHGDRMEGLTLVGAAWPKGWSKYSQWAPWWWHSSPGHPSKGLGRCRS